MVLCFVFGQFRGLLKAGRPVWSALLMSRAIDVLHLGRDRVICAYESGRRDRRSRARPPRSDTLIDRLAPVEPRALLLTHIHLDHAGATGVLCRRYPKLKVYVHELGAPHLVDPSKLLKSAGAAVRRRHVGALGRGRARPGGAHHRAERRRDRGGLPRGVHARARDPPRVLPPRGVRRRVRGRCGGRAHPALPYTIAPTPPPDIDVEAWLDSLHTHRLLERPVARTDPLRPDHVGRRPSAPHAHARWSTPPSAPA